MIKLAGRIIDAIAGHFDLEKFDDRYEDAPRDLINRKAAGEKITPAQHAKPKTTVNRLKALPASLAGTRRLSITGRVHKTKATRAERRVDVENLG
jgi:DNA end-binding protein Ku